MAAAMTLGTVLVLLEVRRDNEANDGDGGESYVDLGLSVVVGVTTSAMVPLGAWLSRHFDPDGKRGSWLLAAISLVLIATGLYIIAVNSVFQKH